VTRSRQDAERLSYRRREVPGSVAYRPSEAGSWVAEIVERGRRHRIGRYNTRAAAERALVEHAAQGATA